MPKAQNVYFYSKDPDELERVFSEYEFMGRNVRKFRDHVAVYAYPRKPKPKMRRETTKSKSEAEPTPQRTEQRSKRERWSV